MTSLAPTAFYNTLRRGAPLEKCGQLSILVGPRPCILSRDWRKRVLCKFLSDNIESRIDEVEGAASSAPVVTSRCCTSGSLTSCFQCRWVFSVSRLRLLLRTVSEWKPLSVFDSTASLSIYRCVYDLINARVFSLPLIYCEGPPNHLIDIITLYPCSCPTQVS